MFSLIITLNQKFIQSISYSFMMNDVFSSSVSWIIIGLHSTSIPWGKSNQNHKGTWAMHTHTPQIMISNNLTFLVIHPIIFTKNHIKWRNDHYKSLYCIRMNLRSALNFQSHGKAKIKWPTILENKLAYMVLCRLPCCLKNQGLLINEWVVQGELRSHVIY